MSNFQLSAEKRQVNRGNLYQSSIFEFYTVSLTQIKTELGIVGSCGKRSWLENTNKNISGRWQATWQSLKNTAGACRWVLTPQLLWNGYMYVVVEVCLLWKISNHLKLITTIWKQILSRTQIIKNGRDRRLVIHVHVRTTWPARDETYIWIEVFGRIAIILHYCNQSNVIITCKLQYIYCLHTYKQLDCSGHFQDISLV